MRKAFNFYRSYWDVANELNDKDRLAFYDALLTRQFTGNEIELKGLVKFAYLSQKHSIDKQVKGYEDKTKQQLNYPTEHPTQGGTVHPTVQEKGKGKEEEKEYKYSFEASLCEYGFNPELVKQWLVIRKQKKAVNSEIAFKGFIREVEKSHLTKDEILQLCIEKSWKGFEAIWIEAPKSEEWKQDKIYLQAKAQGYVK